MIRPISIVRYERLYLASFVLGLIGSAMNWPQRVALVAANPVLAQVSWILPTFQVIGIAVTLLLWYFTARSPSVAAKWVVVVLAVLSIVGVGLSLATVARGETTIGTTSIVSFAADALSVVAALHLSKADAKLWFGELPDADEPDTFEDMSHER
ncbi:hypothetical protein C8J45_103110 [Sphingomonas sp. PP-CE-3G-477]|uniref:hypothetical protein n=1 Tax=Sphingomonas sp. PP-CE-3G-477 TaxID=2135660 RepID=UPI000D3AA2BA|nr:hypothetical protein [Sphingomonas sp. PP-CE-3G-477]PTQ64263.1 hypothetical protein C8J45_103110 [Sphingomonas sp. PP-CE-3G-477]